MSFLSWTISALTWHHSTHASTPLHCTSSAEDLKDVSRYDTLPCTFCCCFASCSYIGHYSILDNSGGGEHIVIHIGWVIICVIKDIWSHVCKMGRLEQAMTRGGNKWKWSGKTEREKKTWHLAIYQTVCPWIRVMCYKEKENKASRQFSRENVLKAFIVLVAQKDISKTYLKFLIGFLHTTVHENLPLQ